MFEIKGGSVAEGLRYTFVFNLLLANSKANEINPHILRTEVLNCIPDHHIKRPDELMPQNLELNQPICRGLTLHLRITFRLTQSILRFYKNDIQSFYNPNISAYVLINIY